MLHVQKALIFEVATPKIVSTKKLFVDTDRNRQFFDTQLNTINSELFENKSLSIMNSKKIKELIDKQKTDDLSFRNFLNTNDIVFSVHDDDISIRIGLKNNSSIKSTIDSTSKLTVKYSDNSIEEIVSTLESENRIRVRQYSVDNSKDILNIVFKLDNINGWVFDTNEDFGIQGFDSQTALADFNFFGFIFSFILRKNIKKLIDEKRKNAQLQSSVNDITAPCLNHDLLCSGPGSKFSSVILSNICVDNFEVDLSSCCITHDIAYYCTPSNVITYLPVKMAADMELAACAFAKILVAYIKHSPPWYCGGVLTATTAGLIAGAWGALLMYAVVTFMGWPKTPDGFEDSCLCGGSKQTAWCDDPCVDMCEKMGVGTNCFKCKWKCIYSQGKAIGVKHFSSSYHPCCLGTDEGSPCLGSKEDAFKRCPTCFKCHWVCHSNKGKLQRVFIQDKEDNLPCCPGTNLHEIKLRPGWCPEGKKSVGFL